ncbi:hypothetical protein PAMP_006255 [Pampus punctatissimus]
MGNSESQYSIQGPKGTSFVFPGKQKPYSLKLRSAKDDALSPHTWWKNTPVGSGYKARSGGRGCLSPPKSRQPYSARHYDYVSKGARGSPSEHRWRRSTGCGIHRRHMSDDYEDNPYGAELNGHTLNGHSDEHEVLEEQSSPRVVIKKDGSLRVEFTNTSGNALLLDEASGPVQLLKFSPNLESASTSDSRPDSHRSGPPPASTSSTARTSKGSSLSSDGSWYDSPWGPSTELCEQDQPCSSSRTLVHSPIHQLEQCPPLSITDLYRDSTMAATFPSAKDLSSHLQEPPPGQRTHRASFASVLDVPLEEECLEARQFSSYTLPCRRPKAHTVSEDLDQYPNQEQHQEQVGPDFGFHKKGSIKNRIRRLSDWTGSLSRKKRKSQETRYKDLSDAFDSGVDGLTADTSSPSQVSSLLWFPGASRAQSSGAIHQTTNDAVRQNIYENFMRELEMGTGQGGGERREPSTGTEEGESSSESAEGSLEQLDLLFEKEQGVVRRAGWLSFKPLVTLHKDRKLELVTRRKWKQYWVTLKGCTLLFYETYGRGSPEQDLSPRYALLAEDSIVQAVPEHPKKENVFCLSNSYGDVYLFQASNQTDLENWVTAIHSASASLLAKRQGKEDTVRLLRSQVRGLLQKIDMDGKMKKMAELQLTVVSDPKNRKAIENQIQQWEQNLERFNMDLFRMRCYLASLQGGELPNPKSLLAIASRPTKSTLGRLGIFSVSSFHALICSRDEATLRRRSLSLTYRQRKRGLFSSLKGLDNLTKRGRDKRPSASQIFESDAGGQTYVLPPRSTERLDVLTSIYSMSPPEGGVWDSIGGAADVLTCVYMPDSLTVQVPVRRDQTAADLLSAACKVKQLDPGLHYLRLHRRVGADVEVRHVAPGELLRDVVNDQLEVVPVNVFTLHMSRPSGTGDFGFAVTGHIDSQKNSRIFVSEVLPDGLAFNEGLRPGNEILVLNGRSVSGLDLALIQTLFAEQTLHLSLRRDGPLPPNVASNQPGPLPKHKHRAKSSSDVFAAADDSESLYVGLENGHSHCAHRLVQHSKVGENFKERGNRGNSRDLTHHDPDLAGMTTQGVPSTAMAVAEPAVTPTASDDDPHPCLCLTTLVELFMQDRSPAQALCSLLSMCWFWPSGSEAEEKDLFMGSALLSLGRLLKDKLADLAQDMADCLSCQRDAKGEKQPLSGNYTEVTWSQKRGVEPEEEQGGMGISGGKWTEGSKMDDGVWRTVGRRINGPNSIKACTRGKGVIKTEALDPGPTERWAADINDKAGKKKEEEEGNLFLSARLVQYGVFSECVSVNKSVDTVCTLYQSFQEGTGSSSGGLMDDTKEPPVKQGGELRSGTRGEATLLRPCPKHMSGTERLRKVIQELVDTEKSYVKMESLFGSLPEMLDFQRVFLQTLEERIASSPDFSTLETPSQFKKLLFSLGGSFLYYADHFKLYSGFCANHIKVQKVLERAKTDQAFKEFLDARNPTKQHSSTLESYLIKPVQRVLKYPLLLRELVSLTDADSEEHYHLTEALKAMEKVASHINEMQKIYEDYGSVFDQLVAEQTGHDKEVTEISMGEFLLHSSVVWLNPHPSLGRMRKDPEMTVFAVILVYRENNKLKKKMTNPRSALSHGDSDPFKFRWLIPLSALQVRLGNTAGTGTESSCIWELIHSRSEVEGRPETVFQLCSSVPESKVSLIKVIRSILRENARRNMRSDGTLERSCKERLAPLRSTLPASARLGSSRASWLCKQPLGDLSTQTGNLKPGPDSDEGSLSSGTYSLSGAAPPCTSSVLSVQTPGCNSNPPSTSVKESDILSDEDDDGFSETGGTRRDSGGSSSPTSAIDAQFLQLKLSEDAVLKCTPAPCVQPEGVGDTPEIQPKLMQGHVNAVKRKTSSFRRSQGALLNMKEHSRSLDSQTDAALSSGVVDLNTLLEREFSVQSLTSVVNEDCFYDPAESCATDSGNAPSS